MGMHFRRREKLLGYISSCLMRSSRTMWFVVQVSFQEEKKKKKRFLAGLLSTRWFC
jgi:hypothetical protein